MTGLIGGRVVRALALIGSCRWFLPVWSGVHTPHGLDRKEYTPDLNCYCLCGRDIKWGSGLYGVYLTGTVKKNTNGGDKKDTIGVSTFYRLDTLATYTVSGWTTNVYGTNKFTAP